MKSIDHKPGGELQNHVESIYYNDAGNLNLKHICTPSLHSEIFFSFGSQFQLGTLTFNGESKNHLAVFANHQKASEVHCSGEHLTMGVLLKPWSLYLMEEIGGKNVKSKSTDFKLQVLHQALKEKQKMFKELRDQEAIEALEEFCLKKLVFKEQNETFMKIFGLLSNVELAESRLNELVEMSGVSAKTFINVFSSNMQVSPLKFLHYNAVIHTISSLKEADISLSQIALESGFYDQSHYNKVFKSFFQITPGAYRQFYRQG